MFEPTLIFKLFTRDSIYTLDTNNVNYYSFRPIISESFVKNIILK